MADLFQSLLNTGEYLPYTLFDKRFIFVSLFPCFFILLSRFFLNVLIQQGAEKILNGMLL